MAEGIIEKKFIDDVKIALRISHEKLDTEIQSNIDTAKAEMQRAGILQGKIIESDTMIATAIKTYCQYMAASDDKIKDGYFRAWEYQVDNLRKSAGYGFEVE